MTSARQIRANRANAQGSTGPRTAAGKAKTAQNAFRHGFNVPVSLDPALANDIEAFARRIAGEDAASGRLELARRIAETHIDLRRVRSYRHTLIDSALRDETFRPRLSQLQVRVEKLCIKFNVPARPPLKGPEKHAAILMKFAKELAALDRYERRALSRRKFAIRAFDETR